MANNVMRLENMSKHLTKDEIEARAGAEAELLPERKLNTRAPKQLAGDAKAKGYWKSILERMEGVGILDDLDREVLAAYCAILSRRDRLQAVFDALAGVEDAGDMDPQDAIDLAKALKDMSAQLQSTEKTMLSYAGQLGLTPESRARLARKRAVQQEADPDADLFGD